MAETQITTLAAQLRETRGKQAAKHMRQDSRVPAVLYYANDDKTVTSIALDFDDKDIRNLVAHRTTLLSVSWGEGEDESRECILREVQRHPVTQLPMHIDLLGIQRGVKMDSTMRIVLEGTPVGVKDEGGILQQVLYEFNITCLPKHLRNEIVIDVADMKLGDSLHVSDIEIEDVEITDDPARTVVTVVMPRVIEEPTDEDEEGEEGEEGEGEEGEGGEDGAEGGSEGDED
ncbi:50S ribosomal protein L25 [bacterium]|nr:50S ribosomal protein L25 [bacterium]